MKRLISIALTIALVCSSITGFCQYANLEFIENKGQWDERIKFKGVLNNGAFFLEQKGFSVLQHNDEDLKKLSDYFHGDDVATTKKVAARAVIPPKKPEKVIVHSHAYDVRFLNAGEPVIAGDKPLTTYNNYFLGSDSSKWKANCRVYQAITYQNIYPGIDVRYFTDAGRVKYDIIVHAGADITPLAMQYDGVDGLAVKNGELVIKTSVGDIKEMKPYAYQVVNGQKKEVACKFRVAGNIVRFEVGAFSVSSTLVIDPTLIFSTFTGSTADNWGYTATYGPDGSFYSGGIVFGTGFKTSPGAFQTAYGGGASDDEHLGGFDIGIMKFTPDGGTRAYATYIGGDGNEHPHSLVVDGQGNLVVAGRTNSANYPLKVPKVGTCLKYDIVLTKLNAAGTDLIGSIKIGGSEDDGINIGPKYADPRGVQSLRRNYGDDSRSEVLFDAAGNILLASSTRSGNFPMENAFQPTFGGNQDGVIIKASPDLSTVLLSSFIGGSEEDAAFVLAINPNDNNVYIGGNTVSTNLPGSKSGSLYTSFQGGQSDGFVSIMTNGGTLLKTTYMGTGGNDMLYGIQFDRFGFPYIMGTTSGSWPVISAPFSQPGGKQFISKLKPDLSSFVYSTVFGTNNPVPNISPVAFLVDRCENVYVSGWGGVVNNGNPAEEDPGYPNAGTNGLTVTPDAIQPSTDGSDFYFFVLARDAAAQLYGSFFGQNGQAGEHVDGGTSRFDRNGVIYQALCACQTTGSFPVTPGVWSPASGSSNCNLAAVKIAFNLAGVVGSVKSFVKGVQDTTGCAPLTVAFTDTIGAGKSYVWNFGDGSPEERTTIPGINHTYNNAGSYRVRLISIDSAKCNVADTAYTNIIVRSNKAILDFESKKLLPCEAFNFEFANTSIAQPAGRTFTDTSFMWDFGDNTPPVIAGTNTVTHSFAGPGTYNVRLFLNDTAFCNSPDSLLKTLRIATNVKAAFVTPANGCAPYTAAFDNISEGGQQFFWDFGDGTTSTESSPVHLYATPNTYLVKLRAVDPATCNVEDSTSFTITVSGAPVAAFTYAPNPPQENMPVEFTNSSIGAVRFLWKFGDGDSLATSSSATIAHTYNETGTFNTCLIAINNFGCQDTVCQDVTARIVPISDVPNAFTPNGDGINDKVFVKGFGITKMIWRIYNRWGVLVFETADRNEGWDGTYKGSPQPKEVYHYVLDAQYSDKTTFQKKGDITLLR